MERRCYLTSAAAPSEVGVAEVEGKGAAARRAEGREGAGEPQRAEGAGHCRWRAPGLQMRMLAAASLAVSMVPSQDLPLRPLPRPPRSPSSSLAAASPAPQVRIPHRPLPDPRVPPAWPRPCSRSSSHRGDARVSAGCLAPAAVPRPAVAGSLTDPTTAALGRMARAGHLAQLQACKFVPSFSITCTAIFAEKFGRAGIQAVLHMKQLQANSVRPGFGSTSRSSTRWMWFT